MTSTKLSRSLSYQATSSQNQLNTIKNTFTKYENKYKNYILRETIKTNKSISTTETNTIKQCKNGYNKQYQLKIGKLQRTNKNIVEKFYRKNYENVQLNIQQSKDKVANRRSRWSIRNLQIIKPRKFSKNYFVSECIHQQKSKQVINQSIKMVISKTDNNKWLKIKQLEEAITRLSFCAHKQRMVAFSDDISSLKGLFQANLKINEATCIFRGFILKIKTQFGKLLFFLGLELEQQIKKIQLPEFSLLKITKCLHHQVYYALFFKIPNLAMQSLIQCARIYANDKKYEQAEYFCDVILTMSAHYKNKYYEESALQQIGLCQYKRGNLQTARFLHENLSKMSAKDRKLLQLYYQEDNYIKQLKNYLFEEMELKMQRQVRLIQLIKFDGEGEFHYQQYSQNEQKIILSKFRRNISAFKIQQLKIKDIRESSSKRAFQQIRASEMDHLRAFKNRRYFAPEEGRYSFESKASDKKNILLITHQSLNRIQNKNNQDVINIQKNINNFLEFLRILQRTVKEKIMQNRV